MLDKAEQLKRANQLIADFRLHVRDRDLQPKDITCVDCPDNDKCEWAWDLYNTDGDCLALK